MPLTADRVEETSSTTGAGNITLAGANSSRVTFSSTFAVNDRFYYTAEQGTEWEVGIGYLSASTTLVRETVLASSNAGALVNFSASPTVFATAPGNFFHSNRLGQIVAHAAGLAML
jgi:hypothetical protein